MSRARVLLALLCVFPFSRDACAWPWTFEPQPALHRREAIWADPDSPLAWDSSRRALWHLSGGSLVRALWSGRTLVPRQVDAIVPKAAAGLLVDPGVHFLYCADTDGLPHCVRFTGGAWRAEKMSDAPVARFLAVDTRRRAVFAYDAVARGIQLFSYDAKSRTWAATLIVTGLGSAEEAGAYDSTARILYSSHETADASIPRNSLATMVGDPTGIGAWKPWPLVATSWDGTAWNSQVIDETGVSQQPAVRFPDRRVFYAQRDQPERVSFYQPARGKSAASIGGESGWSGADTFVDHHYYEIRQPNYPDSWGSYGVSMSWAIAPPMVSLQAPFSIVPCHEPIWTDTPLPTRLVKFRAVVNPAQTRLVQHRLVHSGEVMRVQSGQRLAGYLYRDANGVLVKELRRGSRTFPALDATFDPANPPAHFAELSDTAGYFWAMKQHTTLWNKQSPGSWFEVGSRYYGSPIPPHFSLNSEAPWVGAHLRLPTTVRSRTFGHQYRSSARNQKGGRYREFPSASTDLAAPSHLVRDSGSGVTFYTQPPEPRADSFGEESAQLQFAVTYPDVPLAGFSPEPELKFKNYWQIVWIAMVY